MTKGALYHHFSGKEDLFRAVFEQVQHEVSDQAVAEFLGSDSWEALLNGCSLWIDAHLDPTVGASSCRTPGRCWRGTTCAPSRTVTARWRCGGRCARRCTPGDIERRPLRPMALLVLGALSEGCLYIAEADDPDAARAEVALLVAEMLSGFRIAPEPTRGSRGSAALSR